MLIILERGCDHEKSLQLYLKTLETLSRESYGEKVSGKKERFWKQKQWMKFISAERVYDRKSVQMVIAAICMALRMRGINI